MPRVGLEPQTEGAAETGVAAEADPAAPSSARCIQLALCRAHRRRHRRPAAVAVAGSAHKSFLTALKLSAVTPPCPSSRSPPSQSVLCRGDGCHNCTMGNQDATFLACCQSQCLCLPSFIVSPYRFQSQSLSLSTCASLSTSSSLAAVSDTRRCLFF